MEKAAEYKCFKHDLSKPITLNNKHFCTSILLYDITILFCRNKYKTIICADYTLANDTLMS